MLALLGSLDIEVTPPLGLVYGHVLWFVSRVIKSKTFRELKTFRHERYLRFCGDSDYVKTSCTGREISLVVLALRC